MFPIPLTAACLQRGELGSFPDVSESHGDFQPKQELERDQILSDSRERSLQTEPINKDRDRARGTVRVKDHPPDSLHI